MGPVSSAAGIVAEFNPFHRGHEALIRSARASGAEYVAVVMSGDFVQRGAPALVSKWDRAEMALRCGADAVFELPLPWAMAGAERFALGGVFLLAQIGCTRLCFGSESGSAETLARTASLLLSPEFSQKLKQELQTGVSFARARETAVRALAGEEAASLLRTPNDTLGVEYLKAAQTLGVRLESFPFQRVGAGHHDVIPDGEFASATAIRRLVRCGGNWEPFVPQEAAAVLRRAIGRGACPADISRMERAILARLRVMERDDFASLPDVSEGLEHRLFAAARAAGSLEEYYSLVKTKRYPLARLRRIVFSAFLGLTAEDGRGLPPYLRVLGFTDRGLFFLREAKRTGNLPVLSHSSDLLHLDKRGRVMVELEGKGSNLHALFLPAPLPCGTNLSHGVVRLRT